MSCRGKATDRVVNKTFCPGPGLDQREVVQKESTISPFIYSSNMCPYSTTMNLLRVNKLQRCLFKGTSPVTSCLIPKGTIFAIFLSVFCTILHCGTFVRDWKTGSDRPVSYIQTGQSECL